MITKEHFGTKDGSEVFLFTLKCNDLFYVQITNFGGIIKSIVFDGTDVVLGRDSLDEYLTNEGCLGALIGRNSNRIENSKFSINGETYNLAKNDGENNLHGGIFGFNQKVWEAETIDKDEPQLVLSLTSPDGEEGFPGTMKVNVTYTVTAENSLKIHYEATCDKDTIANFTNHSYFNLNGHTSGTVDNHTIMLNSHFYTPNKPTCVPSGEILSSEGTVFDLTSPVAMRDIFNSDSEQIKLFGGFDHNFCIDGRGFRKAAEFIGDKTGIKLETFTDLPGIQLYSGNCLTPDRICKDGAVYDAHHAVCFETQFFPNSANVSHFPSCFLKAGEKFDSTTEYKLSK